MSLVKKATEEQKDQLSAILNNCQRQISSILKTPVVVMYKLRVNSINENIVIQTVCSVLGTTYSNIVGPNKSRDNVLARDLISYLTINYCGLSHEQAAALISRERSSVTVAVQKVNDFIQVEDAFYMTPLQECERLLLNIIKEN